MTKKSVPHNPHHISWVMKLTLALAFLPLIPLVVALIWHLPLPTVPFYNFTGNEPPEYYAIFMANTNQNLPGSIIFSAVCFLAGIGMFCYLALERGSLATAWRDCVENLKTDFNAVLGNKPTNDDERKKVVYKSLLVGTPKITKTPESKT